MAGFFIAAGNTPSSHQPAMTLDTQMTLALLQELLLALRANEAEGCKGWLARGLEEQRRGQQLREGGYGAVEWDDLVGRR